MSDDYTPSVEEARATYAEYRDSDNFSFASRQQMRRFRDGGAGAGEFDRMIAQVRRDAEAEQRERDAAQAELFKLYQFDAASTTGAALAAKAIATAIRKQGTDAPRADG